MPELKPVETDDAIVIPPTPMCDAWASVHRTISEFREIFEKAQKYTTSSVANAFLEDDVEPLDLPVKLCPPIRKLLMQYYQIDENQLEAERQMLLDAQCLMNDTGKPIKYRVEENVNG